MRSRWVAAVLLFALSVVSGQTAKPLVLDPQQVERIEILYFSESALVRADISPERLEQWYRYKLEIRKVHELAEWQKGLAPLLQSTSVTGPGRSYDHRIAVLLFDKDGRRIGAVFFDASGHGTLNGEAGSISGGLYHWAKFKLKGVQD